MKFNCVPTIINGSAITITGPAARDIVRKSRVYNGKLVTSYKDGKLIIECKIDKRQMADEIVRFAERYYDVEFCRIGPATACAVREDGRNLAGVAICNPSDRYDFTVGKAIAFLRATHRQIPAELLA